MANSSKSIYDRIARYFDKTRSYLWDDLRVPAATAYLKEGSRVLDLGCGTGRLCQLFEKRNITYTGLDESEGQIALARERFPTKEFVVGDMRKLPFPDQSFDLVYCIAAFHHLITSEDRKTALGEMRRVLKPDGHVIMLNWNLRSVWAQGKIAAGIWGVTAHPHEVLVPWKTPEGVTLGVRSYYSFSLQELAAEFEANHFSVIENSYIKKGQLSDMPQGENILSVLELKKTLQASI